MADAEENESRMLGVGTRVGLYYIVIETLTIDGRERGCIFFYLSLDE